MCIDLLKVGIKLNNELSVVEIIIRIVLAMLFGGIVGLDRSLKNRPAGMRTHMLVCVGSCIIMMTNLYAYNVFTGVEPVRMGAQVVSGIGFLGAGTIMISYNKKVTGLTTAASLWTSAALGLSVGIGFYWGAIIGGFAVFIAINLLYSLDNKIINSKRHIDIYVELAEGYRLGEFIAKINEKGLQITEIQLDRGSNNGRYITGFLGSLKSNKEMDLEEVKNFITSLKEVEFLNIL